MENKCSQALMEAYKVLQIMFSKLLCRLKMLHFAKVKSGTSPIN